MMRGIHGAAKLGDAAGHSGGRLIVDDHHGFNTVVFVISETRRQFIGRSALAPVAGNIINLESEFFRDLAPEIRKMSCFKQEHAIARGQSINEGRFPSAGPRSWIHDNGTGGLEDFAHAVENFRAETREFSAAMVNDRIIHGPQYAIRDICGTGYL